METLDEHDEDFCITAEEAFDFLTNILCIHDSGKKLNENKLALLDEILKAMHHHIPFQTVRSLSIPHRQRHTPTLAEIKADVSGKLGGLCYGVNSYGMVLLRAIGYDVTLVPCDFRTLPSSHNALIVNHVTGPASRHLVDFAAGAPSFRPISLDFGKTSPEYVNSYLRYRFVRHGDTIIRQHRADTDPGSVTYFKDCIVDGWIPFLKIRIAESVTVSHFKPTLGILYTDVNFRGHPYLSTLICHAYPHGRLVSIKNTTLLIEGEEGRVEKSYFRSRDQIMDAFRRHFPQFPQQMVEDALDDENVELDYNKHLE